MSELGANKKQHVFELRTLLGNVTAMLELSLNSLEKGERRDAQVNALDAAYKAGEVLQRLLEEVAPSQMQITEQPSSSANTKLRVLVVDDNPINQKLVNHVLAKRGYEVTVATNGKAALDELAKGEFDVVLMDSRMPVMDGMTATSIIRNQEQIEAKPRLPIVALTAIDMSEPTALAWAKLVDGYISKPFHPDTLNQAIVDSIVRARVLAR